jgi:hypothetical protein
MIHNVLHNMQRARNIPSHFPLPGSGSASLQCPFIQQLLVGLALIVGEGHATFRAGLIGGRGGAVGVCGGGALASTAAAAPSFLGGYLVYQASILRARYFMQGFAGFVVDFIQLLHGASVPVQEVKLASIMRSRVSMKSDTPRKLARQAIILSGEEARQTGHLLGSMSADLNQKFP